MSGGWGREHAITSLRHLASRWVVPALTADAALAVIDAAVGRAAILTTAFLVPPPALALVARGGSVGAGAVVSIALAMASGSWNDYLFTGEHIYRVAIVAGSGLLAVVGAELRARAVSARDRMGLLDEIAQIAEGGVPVEDSLPRLGDVLVPAAADLCEIVTAEPERVITRVAGALAEPDGRPAAGSVDEHSVVLAREALKGGQARLITDVEATQLGGGERGEADRQSARRPRIRSAIVVPVRSGARTLAALLLAVGPSGRRCRREDLRFAVTVASRAGLAIENARLVNQLGEARRRMEAIVGSLADAVTIRYRSGHVVYANQTALEWMRIGSVDEIVNRDPEGLLRSYIVTDEDGNELPSSALPSVRLRRGEDPEPLVLRYVDRVSGTEQWRVLKATPLHDAAGGVEAAVTIIEDVTTAKRAERQTGFLARASDILASSLDYAETLGNVAWLAVPDLADWCGVDLVDERGRRRQVAIAHRDPQKLTVAEPLREYEPVELDPTRGLGAVLATGKSQLYPEIPGAMLEAAAVDEEHLRLLRAVGMRSVLIVAMRTAGRIVGAMTWVSAESARRFTEDDVRFAEQVAARAAVAVENARLYTEHAQIASTLQESLRPEALPSIAGWDVASLYRPAGSSGEVDVGGDFYDAFETGRGWLILIGDVTGKGVEAAAMTSLVRYGARFVGEQLPEPTAILARLDAALRRRSRLSLCSALCLRIAGDRVSFASAGHPLPLLVTDDGVRSVGRPGPVLGAFEDSQWPTEELTLAPEELLLLYTDGVTDTVGPAGRFGEQRLRQTTAECGPLPVDEFLACIDKALTDFQVGPQADDTAAVALRLSGEAVPRAHAAGRRAGR